MMRKGVAVSRARIFKAINRSRGICGATEMILARGSASLRSGHLRQPRIGIRSHPLAEVGQRIHRFFHKRAFLRRDEIVRHGGHAHFKFAAAFHFRDFRLREQMPH